MFSAEEKILKWYISAHITGAVWKWQPPSFSIDKWLGYALLLAWYGVKLISGHVLMRHGRG